MRLLALICIAGSFVPSIVAEALRSARNESSTTLTEIRLNSYPLVSPTTIYYCPAYSASNTASTTQNYVNCYFSACGGTTVIISGCEVCSGDQYLRLYVSATQVTYSDDYCSACSYTSYSVPGGSSTCYDFNLREGCFSSYSCSGTISVRGSNYAFPTAVPTLSPSAVPTVSIPPSEVPTLAPSGAPSVSFAPTYTTLTCPAYAINYYSYFATSSYATCSFIACSNSSVTLSYSGTTGQYLRVMDESGSEVSYSGGCNSCSTLQFIPSGNSTDCEEYAIREGCQYWYYACDGTVSVTGDVIWVPTAAPSEVPTEVPTWSLSPTVVPSEVPTESPTVSFAPTVYFNLLTCPYYAVDYYSYFATNNYDTCSFIACGGSSVTLSYSGSGNQYLRVMDESGSEVSYSGGCNSCSTLSFVPSGNSTDCKEYTIYEGCLSWYYYCYGTVTVGGDVEGVPSAAPSEVPTEVPTLTIAPTYSSLACGSYYASYTYYASSNYAICTFSACGGSPVTLSIVNGDYYQYYYGYTNPYVRVYDGNGYEVGYESGCNYCSYFTFTPPGTSSDCQVYTIHEGCNSYYSTCTGYVSVSATFPPPTVLPTVAPTPTRGPTLVPTGHPIFESHSVDRPPSLMYSVVTPVVVVSFGMMIAVIVYFWKCAGASPKIDRVFVASTSGVEMT